MSAKCKGAASLYGRKQVKFKAEGQLHLQLDFNTSCEGVHEKKRPPLDFFLCICCVYSQNVMVKMKIFFILPGLSALHVMPLVTASFILLKGEFDSPSSHFYSDI
jgi:hypothetical protein